MQGTTKSFKVLYTKNKGRKRKNYQDGILKVNGQKKAFLFDENHAHLASDYLAKSQNLEDNTEIELGEFFIQLNEPCTRNVKIDAHGTTKSFKVLYMNHKGRKTEVYEDGILKVNGQKKAFLFDENHAHLASEYLAKSQNLKDNTEIELGDFLIQLNEPCTWNVKIDVQDTTKSFKVLYTNHKGRKRKVYQDGILEVNWQKKAFLFDDNHAHLASDYLAKSQNLEDNTEIELEDFLIQLNEPCRGNVKIDVNPGTLCQNQKKKFSFVKELSNELGLKQEKGSTSLVRNGPRQTYQVTQEVTYIKGTDPRSTEYLTGHIVVQKDLSSRKCQVLLYDSDHECLQDSILDHDEIVDQSLLQLGDFLVQVEMGSCPGSKEPRQAKCNIKCISTITQSRSKSVDEIMKNLKKVEDRCLGTEKPPRLSEEQSQKKRIVYSKRPVTSPATKIKCRSMGAGKAETRDLVVKQKPLVPNEQPLGVKDHYGENDEEVESDGFTSQLTSLTDLMESKLGELGDEVAAQNVRPVLGKMHFSAMNFWEGYKYYCIGYYAKSAKYQGKFCKCKMGHIIRRLYYKEDKLRWNANLDEKIREAWFIMEEYIMETERIDCRDLESLIRKYDDPAKLATTEHGQFFLELCKSDSCSTPMPSFIVAR